MNLNFDSNIYNHIKWIPVTDFNDNKVFLTLKELFLQSHLYKDYCLDSIPEKISIQHFINFIGKAFFRKNPDYELLDNIKNTNEYSLKLRKDITVYLDNYAEHFQLAGPKFFFAQRPFYAKLTDKDSVTPIAKLIPEIESGNNGSFFTRATENPPPKKSINETIFALLQGHLLNYGGTGGGFKNEKTSFTDTVTARSISTFIKEETLSDTIFKNIYLYHLYNLKFNNSKTNEINQIPTIWECSDHGDSIFQSLKSLSGCEAFEKFGYERMYKIDWQYDDETNKPFAQYVKMAQGIEKSEEIELFYPALITSKDKKEEENIYIKAKKEKVIWRDIDSIAQKFSPLFSDFKNFLGTNINIEILALYTDKAKIEGSIRSYFSLPLNILSPEKLITLKDCLKVIENNSIYLKILFKKAIQFSLSDDKSSIDESNSLESYWNHIGLYFTKNATLKRIADNEDDLELKKDLSKQIYFAKEKAIEKFIQNFPDKKAKFKMMGYLHKELKYDGK